MSLEKAILNLFEMAFPKKEGLTIGIEQEFFLLTALGDPASPEEANAFLQGLISIGYYTVCSTYDNHIESISYKEVSGRNTIIKFDHHPHLLEIATDYFYDLGILKDCLAFHLDNCANVANGIGLKLQFSATLPLSAADKRLHSEWTFYKNLRYYRKEWMIAQGIEPKPEKINYAAGIAATQIHVGGIAFEHLKKLISRLYTYEPVILALHKNGEQGVAKRWSNYQYVFEGSPLVAFPNLQQWSWETYTDALQNTPLYGSEGDGYAGKTFNNLQQAEQESFTHNPELFLSLVRDQQLIKPRIQGTIEFRADPAQSSIEDIMHYAALRLALVSHCLRSAADVNFQKAREEWDRCLTTEYIPSVSAQLFTICKPELIIRGKGEEEILNPSLLLSDNWKDLYRHSVQDATTLAKLFPSVDAEAVSKVNEQYNMRINPYYLSLIEKEGDPIWLQAVPEKVEIEDFREAIVDPLSEEEDIPVPGITHRYPDRVLFLISHECPIFCRFCTRKRKVGQESFVTNEKLKLGLDYIRSHPEIRDVILSGGDPLSLSDKKIEYILGELRAIQHVEIIRIGTKVPCILPQRITPELCSIIKRHHPVYINTHFNHPRELTPEAKKACDLLADAGCPIGNQSVLLKGVNDDPQVMKSLMIGLLKMRVRPYYIYMADLTKGATHFRTSVQTGLEIIKSIRGWTSGLAVPHLVIDAPGGGGKIPILPEYVKEYTENEIVLENYEGKIFKYPLE